MTKDFFIYNGKLKLQNGPGCYKITEDPLWLLSILPLDKKSYLEVGCGTGVISIILKMKNPAAFIKAIDIQKCMIEHAKKHALDNNIKDIKFENKNLYSIGSKDKYSCVFSNPPFFNNCCCDNKQDEIKNIAYLQESIASFTLKALELVENNGILCFMGHISTRDEILKCFKNVCDLTEIGLVSCPNKKAKRYIYIIKKNSTISYKSLSINSYDQELRDNILHKCKNLDII